MLFLEMRQEVKNIIQDSSLDSAVPGYINEAFLQASGRVNIPDLKRVGIASTVVGQMYTPLAGIQDGFGGRLSKLLTPDILRFRDIETLMDWVINSSRALSETGVVEAVALEGKTLWYFPTPVAQQDLSCILFSNPVLLEDKDDSPDAFPEICHRNIGIHGACYQAFSLIEDGIEGIKVNTDYHFGRFEAGVVQLQEWIARHRTHQITSVMNEEVSTTQWGNTFARWR